MEHHPVPARLKAFARHQIDFGGEVQQHLLDCDGCAQLVAEELQSAGASAEQDDAKKPDRRRR